VTCRRRSILVIWEEKGKEEWNMMTDGTHMEEKEMASGFS
jgi:hypothetical protein